jgi:hypothetical protein
MKIEFPKGRTRFTSAEVMRMLGIPTGSKPVWKQILKASQVQSVETIGPSKTFDREGVKLLGQALQRRLKTCVVGRPPGGSKAKQAAATQ